jgi:hypothetical protein
MGSLRQAADRAAAIVSWIDTHDADGLEYAIEVYWDAYRILHAAAAEYPAYATQAEHARQRGLQLLHARAGLIQDPELRRAYLNNVPAHRTMAALAGEVDGLAAHGTTRS